MNRTPSILGGSKPTHERSNENGIEDGTSPTTGEVDIFSDQRDGGGMRVGRDYQAKIPPAIPEAERNPMKLIDKALLIWAPPPDLTDEELEEYTSIARDKYNYSGEQALGLLFWHGYDLKRAMLDLANFTPNTEDWTVEDKVLFEQAFAFHGKVFDKIHQMLPDKTMTSLIKYYYLWKKSKNKSSIMDRPNNQGVIQPKKSGSPDEETGTATNNNDGKSNNLNGGAALHTPLENNKTTVGQESDDEIINKRSGPGKYCENCGVPCTLLYSKDKMCKTCFIYWERTGDYRPLTGPLRCPDKQILGLYRTRRLPPVGIYLNHDDLSLLAGAPPQAENIAIRGVERQIREMKFRIQKTKQDVELMKKSLPPDIDHLKPPKDFSNSSQRINNRWTEDELQLTSQGFRRYGNDFKKIAQIVGTKTESHIKLFYTNYRKRYDLDSLIREHDLDSQNQQDNEESD